jgi:hypothetical protein
MFWGSNYKIQGKKLKLSMNRQIDRNRFLNFDKTCSESLIDLAKPHLICLESILLFRAFTVQNPANYTQFAWSQTYVLSTSDQSEEHFPINLLGVNCVHRLELAGNLP